MRLRILTVPVWILSIALQMCTTPAIAEWSTTTDRDLLAQIEDALMGNGGPPSQGWIHYGMGDTLHRLRMYLDADQSGHFDGVNGVKQWIESVETAIDSIDSSLDSNATTGDGVRRLLELMRTDLADIETALGGGGGGGSVDVTAIVNAIEALEGHIDATTTAINTQAATIDASIGGVQTRIDTTNASMTSALAKLDTLIAHAGEGFTDADVVTLLADVSSAVTDLDAIATAATAIHTLASTDTLGLYVRAPAIESALGNLDTASIVTELQVLQNDLHTEMTQLQNVLQTGNIALEAQLIRAKLYEIRSDTQSTVDRLIDVWEVLDDIRNDTGSLTVDLDELVGIAKGDLGGVVVQGAVLSAINSNTAPLHADLQAIGVDLASLIVHAAAIEANTADIVDGLGDLGVKLDDQTALLSTIESNTRLTSERLYHGDKSAAEWLSLIGGELQGGPEAEEQELVVPEFEGDEYSSDVGGLGITSWSLPLVSPLTTNDTQGVVTETGVGQGQQVGFGNWANLMAAYQTATTTAQASTAAPPPLVLETPSFFGFTAQTITLNWTWFDGGIRTAFRGTCILFALAVSITMVWSEFSRS